jgi:hypothetical protein
LWNKFSEVGTACFSQLEPDWVKLSWRWRQFGILGRMNRTAKKMGIANSAVWLGQLTESVFL